MKEEVALRQAVELAEEGRQLASQGKHQKSLDIFLQALAVFKRLNALPGICAAYDNIGLSYLALGNTHQAIENLKHSLAIAQNTGNILDEGRVLGNLGTAYHVQGILDQAEECLNAALLIAQQMGDVENEGAWLQALGGVYDTWGRFEPAIEYVTRALLVAQQNSLIQHEVGALNLLGSIYYKLSNPRGASYAQVDEYQLKAIDCYEQAMHIALQNNLNKIMPSCLIGLGIISLSQKQWKKALDQFERAIDYASSLSAKPVMAVALTNAGLACSMLYEEALLFSRGQLEISRINEFKILQPAEQLEYAQLGELYLKQAIEVSRGIGNIDHERNALINLAAMYVFYRRDCQLALPLYTRALELLEQMRQVGSAFEDRSGLMRWREEVFKGLIRCHVHLNQLDQALLYAEQAKSRELIALLSLTPVNLPESISQTIHEKVERLIGEICQLGRTFHTESAPGVSARMRKLQEELDSVLDNIEPDVPEYVALRRGSPLPYREIQEII